MKAGSDYYATALRNNGVHTTIRVGNTIYQIEGGKISENGTFVSGAAAYPALRAAYVQFLAERLPILGLPGVSPDSLDAAIAKLASARDALASIQASSTNAEYIRTLYPIGFLSALSSLERARLTLIQNGSDKNATAYEAALCTTANAARKDLSSFNAALTYAQFATSRPLYKAAQEESARVGEVSDAIERRVHCLNNNTAADITLIPLTLGATSTASSTALGSAASIAPLVTEAYFASSTTRLVSLASSQCLAALPQPYYFLVNTGADAQNTLLFYYVGDLYFEPALPAASTSINAYVAHTYGASYLPLSPTKAALCPSVGADYARMRSVLAIAAFAEAHPDLAPELRAPLVSKGALSETDAQAYLNTLLVQEAAAPDQYRSELYDLALQYMYRTTGLDAIVAQLADTINTRIAAKKSGLYSDLSLATVLSNYSAFDTLFLTYDPGAGVSTVATHNRFADPILTQYTLATLKRFNEMPSQAEILKDLKAYASFDAQF